MTELPAAALDRLLPDMTGLRALVTGAGSGIGLATAALFARAGARVAANHLPGDGAGAGRIAALGDRVTAVPGDMGAPDSVTDMVATAARHLGGFDVLVNNAGTPGGRVPIDYDDLEGMTEARWQTILSVNLIGPFRCVRAARPHLARGGAVVNTASIAGLGGQASSLAYGASKAGLVNLTRNLAAALGPDIRVNAVAPGLTATGWIADWPEERKQQSVAATDLRRMVAPEDVAMAIAFLAVHPAITGQVLPVDCGRHY